ncbi:MAG: sulfatase [Sedimentisphaerales bacterium]|nr:sulfatase [Sedimentisphaerales bacterium]
MKPNIISFICHDLGKHLGCYGAMVPSPNLDRFAREGIHFTRAFCSSTACSPSRGCLMTGKAAHSNGLIGLAHTGWGLPFDQKTIVDYLNEAGYETVHIGHNHERHPGENRYQIDTEVPGDQSESERSDNVVSDAIAHLKRRRTSEQPFYLNLGVTEVHASRYSRSNRLETYGGITPPEDVYLPNHDPDQLPLRHLFGKFQSAIRFMDEQLGRLFRAVEELGYDENTIVLFTTDHGISNIRSKTTLYERGTEISLMLRLPRGMANGRTIEHLIPNIDIMPTLLEACGIPTPADVQGRSFWPLLTGQPYTPNEQVFTERNFHAPPPEDPGNPDYGFDPMRAVRTERFHYIRRFRPEARKADCLPWEIPDLKPGETYDAIWPSKTKPRPVEELYDLFHDPAEFIDLANRSEYRHVKDDLKARLETWMRETGDFMPDGPPPEAWREPGFGNRSADEIADHRKRAGLDR